MDTQSISYDEIFRLRYNTIRRYIAYHIGFDDPSADELTSDVFVLLLRKWNGLESHCLPVLECWLYKAAELKLKEYHRKQKKHPPGEIYYDEIYYAGNTPDDPVADEVFSGRSADRKIELIKETLSEDDRAIFEWIFEEEKSIKELAAAMGISENALYVRWHRIKRRLRSLLENET